MINTFQSVVGWDEEQLGESEAGSRKTGDRGGCEGRTEGWARESTAGGRGQVWKG